MRSTTRARLMLCRLLHERKQLLQTCVGRMIGTTCRMDFEDCPPARVKGQIVWASEQRQEPDLCFEPHSRRERP